MGDYNWLADDDDDDEDFSEPSGRSGDALKQARTAARKNAREAKELRERLADLEKKDRERAVADAVREHGLNPKIARLVPQDVPTDQVGEFLKEFTEVFGASSTGAEGQSQETPESGSVENETLDPNFAALQRIASSQMQGSPPGNSEADMIARIQGAQSPEDLNLILFGSRSGPPVY